MKKYLILLMTALLLAGCAPHAPSASSGASSSTAPNQPAVPAGPSLSGWARLHPAREKIKASASPPEIQLRPLMVVLQSSVEAQDVPHVTI